MNDHAEGVTPCAAETQDAWRMHESVGDSTDLYCRSPFADTFPGVVSPITATGGLAAHLRTGWAALYRESKLLANISDTNATALFGGRLYVNSELLEKLLSSGLPGAPLRPAELVIGGSARRSRGTSERSFASAPDQLRSWFDRLLRTSLVRSVSALSRRADALRSTASRRSDTDRADTVARMSGIITSLHAIATVLVRAELVLAVHTYELELLLRETRVPVTVSDLVGSLSNRERELLAGIWRMARLAARSAPLRNMLVSQDFETALVRLPRTGTATKLCAGLTHLRNKFGYLSPDGWELCGTSWSREPALMARVVGIAANDGPGQAPVARATRRAEQTSVALNCVHHAIRGASEARFTESLARTRHAEQLVVGLRETASMLNHELRVSLWDMGDDLTAGGQLDDAGQVFMVHASELQRLSDGCDSIYERLRMRSYDFHAAARLEPPDVVSGQPAPVTRWPPASHRSNRAHSPTLPFTGIAYSMGSATGRLRDERDARDGSPIRPGEILATAAPGISTLPTLLVAGGAVTKNNRPLSDFSRLCRALCVPSIDIDSVEFDGLTPGATVSLCQNRISSENCGTCCRTSGHRGGAVGMPVTARR